MKLAPIKFYFKKHLIIKPIIIFKDSINSCGVRKTYKNVSSRSVEDTYVKILVRKNDCRNIKTPHVCMLLYKKILSTAYIDCLSDLQLLLFHVVNNMFT